MSTSLDSEKSLHGDTRDEYNAAHDNLKADDATWNMLAFAGIQHDGQGRLVEYRHCPVCQSTLARPIAPEQALYLCQMQAALNERSMESVTAALALGIVVRPQAKRRVRKASTFTRA